MEFTKKNDPFEVTEEAEKVNLTASGLKNLFAAAELEGKDALSKSDVDKLDELSDFIYDKFDIAIGNRILNQTEKIVPAFVAAGGTKEDALDFMLSKKLFSKIEGRFEDYVKPALEETLNLISKLYGKGKLFRSEKVINKIIKTL